MDIKKMHDDFRGCDFTTKLLIILGVSSLSFLLISGIIYLFNGNPGPTLMFAAMSFAGLMGASNASSEINRTNYAKEQALSNGKDWTLIELSTMEKHSVTESRREGYKQALREMQ